MNQKENFSSKIANRTEIQEKPRTANCLWLGNHKPHIKPHLKGTKTANRKYTHPPSKSFDTHSYLLQNRFLMCTAINNNLNSTSCYTSGNAGNWSHSRKLFPGSPGIVMIPGKNFRESGIGHPPIPPPLNWPFQALLNIYFCDYVIITYAENLWEGAFGGKIYDVPRKGRQTLT